MLANSARIRLKCEKFSGLELDKFWSGNRDLPIETSTNNTVSEYHEVEAAVFIQNKCFFPLEINL